MTGCGDQSGGVGAGSRPAVSAAQVPAPVVTVTPAADSVDVRPDSVVQVSVKDGNLASVKASSAAGTIEGQQDGEQTWKSTSGLPAGQEVTVEVAYKDQAGKEGSFSTRFSTLMPTEFVKISMTPATAGSVVGIGMPILIQFSDPVQDRAAVERRLSVTTAPQQVKGAWNWASDKLVRYRPERYWPSGTQVTVQAALGSMEVAKGEWGKDVTRKFTIGSAVQATVDIGSHQMTVVKDGAVAKTIPITTGKDGFETRMGIKVVMTHEDTHRMRSETIGITEGPDAYDTVVKYALRITNSGEFLHSAPWSVGSQGRDNVSHGCTGMSVPNGKWVFDNMKVGDVVTHVNGSAKLAADDGWTMWNMDFATWAKGSALD